MCGGVENINDFALLTNVPFAQLVLFLLISPPNKIIPHEIH
jgi:hypothetical protein